METIIKRYFKSKNIAIVGATDKKDKYGYKIFKLLKTMGYNVFPINTRLNEIDGIKVYSDILSIEEKIDAVSMIIPPEKAEGILNEIYQKGIKIVWFQPGAESYKLIRFCNNHKIDTIYHRCVLVEAE